MKKILITGGSGFIGHNLVKYLLNYGYEIVVLDNSFRSDIENLREVVDNIKYYSGEIQNYKLLKEASEGVDAIIHLAFINGTKNFYNISSKVIDVGIRGIINVYDAAIENNIKNLFIASSSETYQTPSIIPTPEDVPLIIPDVKNARYSYGGTKILYELMSQHYCRNYFDRVITFRPHNVYGKNMGEDHVIPELIKKITNSIDTIELLGDGEQTRAFCHVNDFCHGIKVLLDSGDDGEIYNIGYDEEVTINSLCRKIMKKMNVHRTIIHQSAPIGETNRRCPDISKIKKLGYSPKINLDMGLNMIIN